MGGAAKQSTQKKPLPPAQKIGENAWNIQSEKNYYLKLDAYYKNLQKLGQDYEINYENCLPFIMILPESLKISIE